MRLVLVVAGALLDRDGRVLVTQRPPGKTLAGLWEFPGGKVEVDERPEQALVRELAEEHDITVEESDVTPLTFASYAYPDMHLLMPLYICRRWERTARSHEGQNLRWIEPDELSSLAMPPADRPLIPFLVDHMAVWASR